MVFTAPVFPQNSVFNVMWLPGKWFNLALFRGLWGVSIHISWKFPNSVDVARVRQSTTHRFVVHDQMLSLKSMVNDQSTEIENKHLETTIAI